MSERASERRKEGRKEERKEERKKERRKEGGMTEWKEGREGGMKEGANE